MAAPYTARVKITTTPAPRSTVTLEVELPADRVARSIDESVRRLGRRTRVPGFRPGKVPRPMLERTLGIRPDTSAADNPIYTEAKDQLFGATLAEALRDTELDILTIPEPEWLRFAEGDGASYRVTLPVRPSVQLGDVDGFAFGIEIDPVDDAKVDAVVEQLREQHASLAPVEDRPIRQGDWVVIGFEGTRDGEPVEGGSSERYPLVVGRERMVPGFEEHLVGLTDGGETEFDLTFPEDYPEASLAGQPVHFHVTVRDVREQILPDATDEWAGELGPFADMAALRADVHRRLEASAKDRARHDFADRIIEYAVANATVEVPDLMIEQEVEVMHDELRLRLAEQGVPYTEYERATGKTDETLHAEYRGPAEHRVKVLLVLAAVADARGVKVDDATIAAEVDRARARYVKNPKLVSYFESDRGRAYLRSTMRRTRVVEQIIDEWLAAHPEVGPVPHLEDDPSVVPSANDTVAAIAAAKEEA